MLIENSNFQAEIESLQRSLNDAKRKECELEMNYKKQLETMFADKEKLIRSIREELGEEKSRADSYLYMLNDAKEELKCQQELAKEYNKEKTQEMLKAQQDELEQEKKKIAGKMKEIEAVAEARLEERNEALLAAEIKAHEDGQIADRKYRTAINEKKAIEAQFKALLESSKIKEERMQKDLTELGSTVGTLLGEGRSKENSVRSLVAALNKELVELQKAYEQRENEIVEDAKRIAERRRDVEIILQKNYKEVEKSVVVPECASVYDAQKRELDLVLRELSEKSKELASLKEKEMLGFKGTRKAISSTLDSLQVFIKKSKQSDEKLKTDLKQLAVNVKSADETHTQEEETSTMQIAGLNEELKKLRLELRARDAQQYEGKNASVL